MPTPSLFSWSDDLEPNSIHIKWLRMDRWAPVVLDTVFERSLANYICNGLALNYAAGNYTFEREIIVSGLYDKWIALEPRPNQHPIA